SLLFPDILRQTRKQCAQQTAGGKCCALLVVPKDVGERWRLASSTGDHTMSAETKTVQALDAERLALPARRAWDADQVGARLGCSARHVFRLADAGLMPWGFKLG